MLAVCPTLVVEEVVSPRDLPRANTAELPENDEAKGVLSGLNEMTTTKSKEKHDDTEPICQETETKMGKPDPIKRMSRPELTLQTIRDTEVHLDAWHAVPPVMSMEEVAPRPTRALPL